MYLSQRKTVLKVAQTIALIRIRVTNVSLNLTRPAGLELGKVIDPEPPSSFLTPFLAGGHPALEAAYRPPVLARGSG